MKNYAKWIPEAENGHYSKIPISEENIKVPEGFVSKEHMMKCLEKSQYVSRF